MDNKSATRFCLPFQHPSGMEEGSTPVSVPAGHCVHQWFEFQARRAPDAIAATFGNQNVTYRQLDERANQLGHHLRRLGVGPESLVGLCLERSLDVLVGILGILKAGGAYVPLDLAYPKDRTAFMAADTRLNWIVTGEKWLEHLSFGDAAATPDAPPAQLALVCLDRDAGSIATESAANCDGGAKPENLAYIIYTSGSTGKPKGVMITHENVARLFATTDPWFQFGSRDVWTFFHSYAFDFSVWEIWGALVYGGRVVVVPYLVSRSPAEFYELLWREKVTVLNQTPSAFRQLIWAEDLAEQARELNLRYVIFGGEALELQSLKPWFDRHSDRHPALINMYGITETTVHVTYRPIYLADVAANRGSVIGVPLPDLRVHLLDEQRQPVKPGDTGEMYVAGAGLGRGYLNRPELTLDRFIPPESTGQFGERLYKTGDLARALPDGDLEYLGRCDHQVKIRGFRIELGEIESVLNRHPGVRESVVVALIGAAGDKHLVAYVVAHPGNSPAPNDLRAALKTAVPDYMVPSAFVFLDSLPLTVNGKVDRHALPAPEESAVPPASIPAAPGTDTEEIVASIWREVLGVQRVGLKDNFFDLGGNSLQLAHVHARLRRQFKTDLSITRMFEFTTISALSAHLSGGGRATDLTLVRDRAARQRQVLAGQRRRFAGK